MVVEGRKERRGIDGEGRRRRIYGEGRRGRRRIGVLRESAAVGAVVPRPLWWHRPPGRTYQRYTAPLVGGGGRGREGVLRVRIVGRGRWLVTGEGVVGIGWGAGKCWLFLFLWGAGGGGENWFS